MNIRIMRGFKKILILLILINLAGCASTLDMYQDPGMDFGAIQQVSVMPLANLTRDNLAGERVRDVFINMLLATGGVYVIPPGEVSRGILRAGITNQVAPSAEDIIKFAGIVKVDAVITGVVREYGEVRSGTTTSNFISLSFQMIESQTGRVVWTASATEGGISATDRLFGGGGRPMNEVTERAINDIIDKLFK